MIFNHARLVVEGYLLPHLQGKFLFLIAKISVIGCVYKCARRLFLYQLLLAALQTSN